VSISDRLPSLRSIRYNGNHTNSSAKHIKQRKHKNTQKSPATTSKMISITPALVLFRNPCFFLSTTTQNPSYPSFTIRSSSSSSSSLQEIEKSPEEQRELRSELYASAPFPPIKAAKRVVLVRHGQSTWNEEGRIQGSSDFSVLTKKGEAQADTSRQMLFDDSFDICFSRFVPRFCFLVFYSDEIDLVCNSYEFLSVP
jgi:hypothetical protein